MLVTTLQNKMIYSLVIIDVYILFGEGGPHEPFHPWWKVAGEPSLNKPCTDRAFVRCDPSAFHYHTSTNTSPVKYVIILRKYQKWSSFLCWVSIPAFAVSVLLILGHSWVSVSMFCWCTCFVLSLAPTPSCITLWRDSILLLLLPHFGSKVFIGFSLPLALRLNTLSVSQPFRDWLYSSGQAIS